MPLRPSSSSKLDKVIKLFCYCKGKKKWHDTSLSLPQGKQRLEALSFLETNCSSFSFTCKLQSLDFNDCLNQLLGYALCVSVTQEFCVCVCVCVGVGAGEELVQSGLVKWLRWVLTIQRNISTEKFFITTCFNYYNDTAVIQTVICKTGCFMDVTIMYKACHLYQNFTL